MTLGDQGVQLGPAQFHERKLSGHKESVQEHQEQNGAEFQSDDDNLIKIHRRTCSPKITFRTSCRLTIPISTWSRPKTMASRWPRRCIRCSAVSSRVSSERNRAGFKKSPAFR